MKLQTIWYSITLLFGIQNIFIASNYLLSYMLKLSSKHRGVYKYMYQCILVSAAGKCLAQTGGHASLLPHIGND